MTPKIEIVTEYSKAKKCFETRILNVSGPRPVVLCELVTALEPTAHEYGLHQAIKTAVENYLKNQGQQS